MSSMAPRLVPYNHPVQPPFKPCMVPFSLLQPHKGAVQKRTVGHRKMSQVSKQSAWWDKFNGTKISPIQLPHAAPIQASYDPIQPLTALYRSPIQKRTVSQRKTSQVSKWSAWWDEFNDAKISPIWLPHTAPIQASYSPIQELHSKVICQS